MTNTITIGVDASNIRAGGGLTHLSCLLKEFKRGEAAINRGVVWGGKRTLKLLQNCGEGIELINVPALDRLPPTGIAWQRWDLPLRLRERGCDILFSPGGILPTRVSVPTVVMSQNLLPFELQEAGRFPLLSFMRLKMRLVGVQQRRSMEQANGLIFLTCYARDTVIATLKHLPERIIVIPHGVDRCFFAQPRPTMPATVFTKEQPFRLLYVSIVDVYKHQWQVAEAVAILHNKGVPVEIDFIGPAYGPALDRLNTTIQRLDPTGNFLHYHGALPYHKLHVAYQRADTFVFASSCENLPNIVLEAMASGLPIACSKKGPMPEILGDAGEYFDPEKPEEITETLQKLIDNKVLRERCAWRAYTKAQDYSWEKCAQQTFAFIAEVAKKSDKFNTRKVVHV